MPEPKIVKNRVHLDLISDSFDAGTERLLGMGARAWSLTRSPPRRSTL